MGSHHERIVSDSTDTPVPVEYSTVGEAAVGEDAVQRLWDDRDASTGVQIPGEVYVAVSEVE
jgi:hypothetical protein